MFTGQEDIARGVTFRFLAVSLCSELSQQQKRHLRLACWARPDQEGACGALAGHQCVSLSLPQAARSCNRHRCPCPQRLQAGVCTARLHYHLTSFRNTIHDTHAMHRTGTAGPLPSQWRHLQLQQYRKYRTERYGTVRYRTVPYRTVR